MGWRDEPPQVRVVGLWPRLPGDRNDLTFGDYDGYSIGFLEAVPQLLADDAAEYIGTRFAALEVSQQTSNNVERELVDWLRHRVQTGELERDFQGRWRYLVGLRKRR